MDYISLAVFGGVAFLALGLGVLSAVIFAKGNIKKQLVMTVGVATLVTPFLLVLVVFNVYLYRYWQIVLPVFFSLMLLMSGFTMRRMAKNSPDGMGGFAAVLFVGPFLLISIFGLGMLGALQFFTFWQSVAVAMVLVGVVAVVPLVFAQFDRYKIRKNGTF